MEDDHHQKKKETGGKSGNDEKQKDEAMSEETIDSSSNKEPEPPKENDREIFAFTRVPRHFGKVLRVILSGHVGGLLVFISPYILRFLEVIPFDLEPSGFVLLVLFGAFLLGLNLPLVLRLTSNLTERDVVLLKSVTLVIYTCQVGCLATLNFSFGFFLAIFTLPTFLFVQSTHSRLRRLCQVLLVFLVSPPCIIFFMTLVYSYFTNETSNYYDILRNSKMLYTDCVLSSLRDSSLIGTWSYPVTLLVILPNWLLFWSIAWM